MKIIKRNKEEEKYLLSKVERVIKKAFKGSNTKINKKELQSLSKELDGLIKNQYTDKIDVDSVQDLIEKVLMKNEYYDVVRAFILYREKKNQYREVVNKFKETIKDSEIITLLKDIQSDWSEQGYDLKSLYSKYISFYKQNADVLDTLIKSSVELTSAEYPNWEFIAARLFNYKLNIKINKLESVYNIDSFYHKIKYLTDEGFYGKYILENYKKEDIDELSQYIDYDKDLLFNYSGIKLLHDRYLIRDYKHEVLERPQEMFMGISLHLGMNEKEETRLSFVKDLYGIISSLKVTMATPTMSNARKPLHQLSSCFEDVMPDNLIGIYKTLDNFAQVSKLGGGMGIYVGKVRANGSAIRGFKGASGGVIPWVRLINDTSVSVDQLGTRNGSCSVTLDVWHKDVPEFLQVRKNNGDDRMKAHDIFPAISYPDLFWKMAKEDIDGMWYMLCPHEVYTIKGYHLEDYYGEEWEKRYFDCVNDNRISKRSMKVKDLIRLIISALVETGLPFSFNRDIVNRLNPNKHKGMVYCSNLCVSGNTKILTKLGYKEIKDLAGQDLEIWNGKEWSLSPIRQTSDGSPLLRIHFSNGQSIDCTDYHKFYKYDGFRIGVKEAQVEAKELIIGDKLIKFDLPIIEGDKELDFPYDNGFFTGDTSMAGEYQDQARIYLYDNKRELRKFLPSINKWRLADNCLIGETKLLKPKYFVPNSDFTIEDRVQWLMGLCDSNGCIVSNDKTHYLQITNNNYNFLIEVMEMLNTLGIECKVVNTKNKWFSDLPTHRNDGVHKLPYRLIIGYIELFKLVELGFKPNMLIITDNIPDRSVCKHIKVTKIEHLDGLHPTYCVNEPKEHKVIFNSILTGNCHEIIQNQKEITEVERQTIQDEEGNNIIIEKSKPGEFVVCNLASLVLGRININDDNELRHVIHTIVRALDNVIDLNYYPIEYAKLTNQKYRAIGLGTSDYHHLLAKNGIKWESQEHLDFVDKLYERINYYAIEASNELAKERGSYSLFKGSDWETGEYFKLRDYNSKEWLELKEKVHNDGLRNSYLIAIAPTGSTSVISGSSAGIDPVSGRYFLEEKKGSIVPRVAPSLNDKTFWLYKPAHTIDMTWTAKAAGIRQRHIDQSQSLNFFISQDYSFRDILNLLILSHSVGVKTTYYFRNRSLEVEDCDTCSS